VIKRTISTIVLWAVVIGTIVWFGATGGVVLLAVFSTLAQYEFNNLLEKCGLPPWKWATLALGFAMVLQAGLNLKCGYYLPSLMAVALTLGALSCAQNPTAHNRLAGSVLSIAYVPGMMMFYGFILGFWSLIPALQSYDYPDQAGIYMAIWVIAVAKFTDVGGYLVGRAIGRHKLAPSISPGKTWEGVVGGLALAIVVGMLSWKFGPDALHDMLSPTSALLLPLPIGIAAIVSDLSESVFKRRAGLKDSGNAIPGIGGALDLADSLLLAGPVAFALLVLTTK